MEKNAPKIVTIGGGTGSFTVLSGLKNLTPEITAIIAMADDGGSTGELRDELGALPPGDIRQALVALSKAPEIMRELFTYRFNEGRLKGHSFGNLFLTALEKVTGSFAEAIEAAEEVLNITGRVLPVTLDDVRLRLTYSDGTTVEGEHLIDEIQFKKGERPDVELTPIANLNPQAKTAIEQADLVVIAPGTLHASLIPNLVVKGMPEALSATKAKVAYVCNLVTNAGQTDNYFVHDYVEQLERFGGKGMIDYVLYNNRKPPQSLLDNYAKEGETWVAYDEAAFAKASYKAIGDDLISETKGEREKSSSNLIRHDSDRVANQLMSLLDK